MTSNDWQQRVLSDAELQQVLEGKSSLEAMEVLQSQMLLRTSPSPAQERQTIVPANENSANLKPEILPTSEASSFDQVPVATESPAATDIGGSAQPAWLPKFGSFESSAPQAGPTPAPSAGAPLTAVGLPVVEPNSPVTEANQPPVPSVPVSDHPFRPAASEGSTASALDGHVTSAPESGADEAALVEQEKQAESASPNLIDELISFANEVTDETPDSAPTEYVAESSPQADSSDSVEVESPASNRESPRTSVQSSGRRGVWSLLTIWNGTGILLFLAAVGFASATVGYSLITTIVGATSALAISGLGFGIAAVSARRARQPQATIARAAFGVRAAAVPLIFVILARYVATAIASVGVTFAVLWFQPPFKNSVVIGGQSLSGFIVVLAWVLAAATVLTIFGSFTRFVVTAVAAITTITLSLAVLVVVLLDNPALLRNLGSLDPAGALATASVTILFVSLVWGTTAADESPELRSNLFAIKIIAASILNFAVVGALALVAGYLYFFTPSPLLRGIPAALAFITLCVLALSHQIRRSADSFSGFGFARTRWWIVLASALIVAGVATATHLLVPEQILKTSAIELLPVVGVPVVAWLAILGMDTVLRREDYHEVSLLRDYGFYGKLRLVNLFAWVLAVAVGFGLLKSQVPGFGWLGYLAGPLGISVSGIQAQMGVWVAFIVAGLAPLFTLRQIRHQEAELLALRARHHELIDVTGVE